MNFDEYDRLDILYEDDEDEYEDDWKVPDDEWERIKEIYRGYKMD